LINCNKYVINLYIFYSKILNEDQIVEDAKNQSKVFPPQKLVDALCEAAANNEIENVKLLLKANANVNGTYSNKGGDYFGETALHITAKTGNLPIMEVLIDARATIDIRDNDENEYTPIHAALREEDSSEAKCLPTIQFLIKNKADLTQLNGKNDPFQLERPLLNEAAQLGYSRVVEELLKANANPNQSEPYYGLSALHAAMDPYSSLPNLQIVKALLAYKADPLRVHEVDPEFAAWKRDEELGELEQSGISEAAREAKMRAYDLSSKTRSALEVATEKGLTEIVALFKDAISQSALTAPTSSSSSSSSGIESRASFFPKLASPAAGSPVTRKKRPREEQPGIKTEDHTTQYGPAGPG
jgi:ankyrin repeat protein